MANVFAGWIAMYKGKRMEIKKEDFSGIYEAKQHAIKECSGVVVRHRPDCVWRCLFQATTRCAHMVLLSNLQFLPA